MRCLSCVALVAVVVACGNPPAQKPIAVGSGSELPPAPKLDEPIVPATAAKPKLVVLLVIDQLPQWTFIAKRPSFTQGFDRLLREGTWHTGEHPSAATLTAPGHALLGTGEPTGHSGILGNEWWDRASNKVVRAAEAVDGTINANWLRVPGLGDSVAAANTGAKAVSVALKDRASVLPLGHAGTAVWYDAKQARFVANAQLPWLETQVAKHPIVPRLSQVWKPLDPVKLAKLSGGPDAGKGEMGEKGFGPTFPHAPTSTKLPADAIYAMPLGNEVVLETALAAIAGEQLGTDDVPDLLMVSLSAHDYVGHGWGHESWEAWDMMLRLDAQLADFLTKLDTAVGKDRWSMILTSDHGASPSPARSGDGGAIQYEQIVEAANRAASALLGTGTWVIYAKYPSVYLSAEARKLPAADQRKVLMKIVYALRSFPGLARVELTADYAGDCEKRTGDAFLFCLSIDRERSGEVFYLPKPHWIFEDRSGRFATAHGSLHPFDREVPLVLLPPGRVAHAPEAAPGSKIQMVRVSTLLAQWLGVTPPLSLPR